jgi:hypothetical protein
MKRWLSLVLAALSVVAAAGAKQASPPPAITPPKAVPLPEFLKAADEVLAEMSKLLDLPVKAPLKKSLRSRDEIRAYLVKELKEDKEPQQRYADQKTLEQFGLIPRGFSLEPFLLDLLTEQVAGLYDPKTREFYIADWIPLDEQRVVMAHELTHALDDQNFNIDPWMKAARPNDDAEIARDAVIEGSALAAMLDYAFREQKLSVRDLPDVTLLIRGEVLKQMAEYPQLAKAPPFIRDELVFPYLAGTTFTQQVLKANSGWGDFHKVFEDPPVSTQQILHPQLYISGTKPQPVSLPDLKGVLPHGWKMLEENVLGEFGLSAVLKQYLGQDRAEKLSPAWAGDWYALFENEKSKQTILVYRLQLDNARNAARFFGQYSEALEQKYGTRTSLFRRPNFFQFQTPDGGVFLRCAGIECLVVEGTSRSVFDKISRAIGWPAAPAPAEVAPLKVTAITGASR